MIKNYTSSVPASRSVQHIEDRLVVSGARNITKDYDLSNCLVGICFLIETQEGKLVFKLPARIDQCEIILKARLKRSPTGTAEKRIKEQAARTSWKLLSDWVDVQMSLIELGQVEMIEIFLPYIYDTKTDQTFYEVIKGEKFKGLLQAPKKE